MDTTLYYATIGIPLWAFILDCLLGDPHTKYHPVALIGRTIAFFEKIFYFSYDSNKKKILYGLIIVLAVLSVVLFVGSLFLLLVSLWAPWGAIVGQVIILYICISPRSLGGAALGIASLIRMGKTDKARQKVGYIVGRDTDALDEEEICRATIETVAENTVDGVLAPLLFFAFFGPLGTLFYRTVNTMDSMLGYKNKKYLYFGRVAARLDDLVNLIPARITFLLVLLASFLLRRNTKNGWRIVMRDAKKHPSPNSGYAEAAFAGVLGIRLGGYNQYGKESSFRAYMGDSQKPLKAVHISRTVLLMYMTTILGVCLTIALHTAF